MGSMRGSSRGSSSSHVPATRSFEFKWMQAISLHMYNAQHTSSRIARSTTITHQPLIDVLIISA